MDCSCTKEDGVGELHHSFSELNFSKDKLQKVAGADDETSFVYSPKTML